MHPVRDFFAEWAENWSRGFSGLFQTMGILPDGRELVEESEEGGCKVVTLPDRAEEGWPGFTLRLPEEAHFHRADNSILGRRAFWVVRLGHQAVVRHLMEQNPDFPPPAKT